MVKTNRETHDSSEGNATAPRSTVARQVSMLVTTAKPVNVRGNSYGSYYNVALIEHDADHTPRQVRDTKKGNAKILKVTYRVHIGATEASYGKCLVRDYEAIAKFLNGGQF